ncbi:MAG: hypothetical protein ACPHPA_04255 [Cycloclasticus pugetii]|jgi:hypothetical protein|uniref:hypothetical protein n=1 Tax=Cycloclasticus pugetii TaxID=34068 RepID=UPI003A8D8FB2
MTKSELYNFFNQKISKTAIVNEGDEFQLIGKFCKVSVDEGVIDLWLCNPRDLAKGLGARRLNSIVAGIKGTVERPFTVLNGEAYTKTRDKDLILTNGRLLGLRLKRQLSAEALVVAKERLSRARMQNRKSA